MSHFTTHIYDQNEAFQTTDQPYKAHTTIDALVHTLNAWFWMGGSGQFFLSANTPCVSGGSHDLKPVKLVYELYNESL